MCLSVPGRVLTVDGDVAIVDFQGLRRPILLDAVAEAVSPGDYVLHHGGVVVRRVPLAELPGSVRDGREEQGRIGSDAPHRSGWWPERLTCNKVRGYFLPRLKGFWRTWNWFFFILVATTTGSPGAYP